MTGKSPIQEAVALHQQGQLEKAKQGYEAILRKNPDFADAVSLLGVLENQMGNAARGLELLERAVKLSPDNSQFLENLGIALRNMGRTEEAMARFGEALAVDPKRVSVGKALGALLSEANRKEEAEEVYRKILAAAPADSEILANLALLKRESGDRNAELGFLWEAASKHVEDEGAWVRLAGALKRALVAEGLPGEELEPIFLACLKHPGVSPAALGGAYSRFLKGRDGFKAILETLRGDPAPGAPTWVDDAEAWTALARPSLLEILPLAVLPDLEIELVLRAARARMAQAVMEEDWDHPCLGTLRLVLALARQSFFNGYVWSYDPPEQEAVEAISARLSGSPLEGNEAHLASIAVVASYVPLSEWDRAAEIVELADSGVTTLHGLVRQQLIEPLTELDLRDRIPTSQPVEEKTSQQVRAMYEEHPYPRWSRGDAVKSESVSGMMRRLFPTRDFSDLDSIRQPTILVAGCGTGYHLLQTYRKFEKPQLMGMDLSLSSLSFAYRKLQEAGIEDVALLHGDLLELAEWEEEFDIIESSGVLHHLADPVRGWKVLRDRLRPGGLMKIGLYSALARKPISEARDFAEEGGFSEDEEGIRAARQAMITEGGPVLQGLSRFRDFFSLPEFRDLVFHVQEHQFDLARLEVIIHDLGLEFLGFLLDKEETIMRFKERFPDPGSEADLSSWRAFEEDNPDTFVGMYQFWLRRPVEG